MLLRETLLVISCRRYSGVGIHSTGENLHTMSIAMPEGGAVWREAASFYNPRLATCESFGSYLRHPMLFTKKTNATLKHF